MRKGACILTLNFNPPSRKVSQPTVAFADLCAIKNKGDGGRDHSDQPNSLYKFMRGRFPGCMEYRSESEAMRKMIQSKQLAHWIEKRGACER